jgi:hypothetical protein
LFGKPIGIKELIPAPRHSKETYYRFYYSHRKRLLAVKKIKNGKLAPNYYIRLLYKNKVPNVILSPRYTVYLKWSGDGKRVKKSRIFYKKFKKKKKKDKEDFEDEEEDIDEEDDEDEGDEDEEEIIEIELGESSVNENNKNKKVFSLSDKILVPLLGKGGSKKGKYDDEEKEKKKLDKIVKKYQKKAKKMAYDTFYFYKGNTIVKIDKLRYKKYPIKILKSLQIIKSDEEEEEEEDEEPDKKKKRIKIVITRTFNNGFLHYFTTRSVKGIVINKTVFHYDKSGEVKSLETQDYSGKKVSHLVQKPYRTINKVSTVLRDVRLQLTFGKYPGRYFLTPPYVRKYIPPHKLKLKRGSRVLVLGEKTQILMDDGVLPYYKIRTASGTVGWVQAYYVAQFTKKLYYMRGVIVQKNTHLYKYPDFNSPLVSVLNRNDQVRLLEKSIGKVELEFKILKPLDYSKQKFWKEGKDEEGFEEEEVEPEEEEDEEYGKKKKKKTPPLKDYQKGRPWYKIKFKNRIGWIYGKSIGENYRIYGNHYFLWQSLDISGALFQFNPKKKKYEKISCCTWDVTEYINHNKYIQQTNWDIRDINQDGTPELLVRRFLDKSSQNRLNVGNDLLVFNLDSKKVFPMLEIPMSQIKFNRSGPLGKYIIPKYYKKKKKKKKYYEEEPEPEEPVESEDEGEKSAPIEEKKEDDEETIEIELGSGQGAVEENEGSDDEYDEGKPKKKKKKKKGNFKFRKSRVWFVSKRHLMQPYILLRKITMTPKKNIIGRPLNFQKRKDLTNFSYKYLSDKKIEYYKFYHPDDPLRHDLDMSDYAVHPYLP